MDFLAIQKKWQQRWEKEKLGETRKDNRPKFFMHFAYPGVSGYMHIGHMRGYSYTDIICRYKRMTGYNVFFPVGTHATGNQAISFAKKIERNDKTWINYLLDHGYPKEKLNDMKNVNKVVEYFNKDYQKNWKMFGFLADWSSFTCTIFPDYNKFIEWQFKKLNDLNYLIKKPYFATFCPNCGPVAVDPSETDISKGGTAEKYEYTLIKFKFKDAYIVAATLRPETMYGQTNLWINPNIEYVKVKVGNEIWICSEQCAEKLKKQKEKVKIVEKIKGIDLIGKYAYAPIVEKELIILPSKFCDPAVGTGIVTSVPSDAPYDYMALKDLQANEEDIRKYKLDLNEIRKIKIIPIIKSEWGDTPAVKICEQMKIKNQNDPKLEEATKKIYKMGFHTGIMNKNCGEFAGMKVEVAKEKMKEKLLLENKADIMYDLSEEVICRCGEKVLIKKIPDQWFIKYSDREWTEKSKKHIKKMKIYPKEYYDNLPSILDWFQDRACARLGNWLGTKLPFDPKWIIEPISDSTLYPAYYIVSRFVNRNKIKLKEMKEDFFDYIFLGKGKPKNKIWKEIREEFKYWYPVDINLGGKEHQTVHFPVYIMNHVAILDKENWPKGIFVNHWVVEKGRKISKTKGGATLSPKKAVEMYSADALRLYYSHVSSPHVDITWNEETVLSYKKHVENIYMLVKKLSKMNGKNKRFIDKFLVSRINSRLNEYRSLMDNNNIKKAIDIIIFNFIKDINIYLKYNGNNKETIKYVLDIWLKTLTPIIPHISEECWEMLGNKKLISTSLIPEPNRKMISKEAEENLELIERILSDIRNISQLMKRKGKKVKNAYIYTIPSEKRILKSVKYFFEKELKLKLFIFSTKDKNVYDPQQKCKKAIKGRL